MKTSLLLRAAQAIKPHVPLIKFRKSQHGVSSSIEKPPVSKGAPASGGGPQFYVIGEDQLPKRFRRQLLDERQIIAINSGGCE